MTPQGSKAQPDDPPLIQSIDDAQVLLSYATREGKTFPDEMVQTIVEAQTLSSRASIPEPELESRFWLAFRNLAAAVRPVSVDSIIATYGNPFGASKKRGTAFGNAVRTKRRYSIGAIVVLFLLMVMQIYWYIGTASRTDLENHGRARSCLRLPARHDVQELSPRPANSGKAQLRYWQTRPARPYGR